MRVLSPEGGDQMRVSISLLAVAATLTLFTVATPARAGNSYRAETNQSFKECKAAATETFQAAKDACVNRDHNCVEVCRADRYDCQQATGVDAAIAQCNDTLAAARAQCRGDYSAGSSARDACIDQAQVVAFQCRSSARKAAMGALGQCREGFIACAKACPAATAQSPANPRQCRLDAKNQHQGAKAACIEDFQVGMDACRHKDHACVEQCRADRDGCRQPVQDQLDSDIAACNAQRDAAKAVCHSLYADGTPELDQCIANAQVKAFECRDTAREAARPGFQSCRQNFKSCVQQCPGA
jgi:hypothetical protein